MNVTLRLREDALQPTLLILKYNQKIIWIIIFLLLHFKIIF